MGRRKVEKPRTPILVYLSDEERELLGALAFVRKVKTQSALLRRALVDEARAAVAEMEAAGNPGAGLIRHHLEAIGKAGEKENA